MAMSSSSFPTATATATATASFPNWVMLERFVFRRDDDKSFPDDTKATLRASGSGSHKTPFTIAFRIADPPAISRLYVQWPQGPNPEEMVACHLVATHRNLVLPEGGFPPSDVEGDGNLRYPLEFRSVGILCQGEEFAVAELQVLRNINANVKARLCVLRSAISSKGEDGDGGGRCDIMELPIVYGSGEEYWDIFYWTTDTVIAFQNYLCWVDYDRGMLFCDVLQKRPGIAFIRFPLDSFPNGRSRRHFSQVYRGVSVTTECDGSGALKFADVNRLDSKLLGSLEPGRGYTITCHTLRTLGLDVGAIEWSKDFAITSKEIWSFKGPELVPHEVLLFPTMSMEMPNVMHFLTCDYEHVIRKMSVVTIDLASKTVLSVIPYVNGQEDLSGEDADMVRAKSSYPQSFLPSEFSKYFNSI
ncbi:hypothetical protein OsI_12610 [Oryza sativa Indica Group]|uniref:DUF1618 domain-containing protein n=1 Tax=Oryza sativa subsp. indica TaxID=39946 RepID=A2XJJ4_ORYSI|nr:hypothetical protein OsI_12610 [Oryza sativa Indica Group]